MKETVLVTGASSFIAHHLIPMLEKRYEVKLLTRSPEADNEYHWDVEAGEVNDRALDDVTKIIHLAGAKLNDGTPLTSERKRLVYNSRIGAADLLRKKLTERNQKLTAFISASAIGYYGFTDSSLEIDENGHKGTGFSADLSHDWEKAADRFKTDRIAEAVAKVRVAIVLGNEGGIFPVFRKLITGNPSLAMQQSTVALPWNHVEDMAGIFAFIAENNLDGTYNSVAPEPASQADIFKAIANGISKAGYQIQPFSGQRLTSRKIQEAGYQFKYPDMEKAVAALLKNH